MKNVKFKLSAFALFIVAVIYLLKVLNNITKIQANYDERMNKMEQETTSWEKEEKKTISGRIVFDNLKNRVCEELDLCWVAEGYTINGDKILKKEFPTLWGDKRALIIPKDEWNNISNKDKQDLGNYLKHISVDKIITGRVIPAEYSDGTINPNRNVITVDETVWNSNN